MLLARGIGQVDTTGHQLELVAEAPLLVQGGGAICGDRLYFPSASHLCSWQLPSA